MNDIIVVDDFITKDYADHIEQIVNEKDFPLHFRKGIVTNEDEHEGNVDGFIHMLYEVQKPVSPRFPLIRPVEASKVSICVCKALSAFCLAVSSVSTSP